MSPILSSAGHRFADVDLSDPGFVAPADAVGGKYCEVCHVAGMNTGPGLRGGVPPNALDGEHAKALWAKSEEMAGETIA